MRRTADRPAMLIPDTLSTTRPPPDDPPCDAVNTVDVADPTAWLRIHTVRIPVVENPERSEST